MASDLASLKAKFTGDIVTPTDAEYPMAIARWAVNAQRHAEIVAFVKDEVDVGHAIQHARANKLPIAIRGGGHSANGASSIEGGLVIDLSKYLNGVRVDKEAKKAYIGGGAVWESVDKETIKYGLATVAGTVNHTGVGGLTLGGGYGWLSGKYGLVIDNLVQATVVTADGSVNIANEITNPDLFFGIRGGGSNFGVVTEFVLQLHPQRATVYTGLLIFPPSALESLVEVTKAWWVGVGKGISDKEAMMQVMSLTPNGSFAITVAPFYNGTEAEGRANFKAFLDLGPIKDLTKETPYEELNALFNPGSFHGLGRYMKGVAHRAPHFPSISSAFSVVQRHSHPATPSVPAFRVNVLFEYFPLAKIGSITRSTTAFRRESTPNVVLAGIWDADEADEEGWKKNSEKARIVAGEIAGILEGAQEGVSMSQKLGYTNYDPEPATKDKAKAVFAENYPRLQEIKKRYDPENVFNKWFPITPA